MYQIAICDDEKIFTDKLAHMIKQYSNAHHHVIDLHLFQQAADFIQSSLESYDIVFLDVRFGEISGIEIAKALRAKNENAILIFVSAFIEYAIMGYSVHASAYLLKSDLDGTFESCMDEIFPQIGSKEISVRVPYEHVNVDIPCKSIIYMESYSLLCEVIRHDRDSCTPWISSNTQKLFNQSFSLSKDPKPTGLHGQQY